MEWKLGLGTYDFSNSKLLLSFRFVVKLVHTSYLVVVMYMYTVVVTIPRVGVGNKTSIKISTRSSLADAKTSLASPD